MLDKDFVTTHPLSIAIREALGVGRCCSDFDMTQAHTTPIGGG